MFELVEPLQKAHHERFKFKRQTDYHFAAKVRFVPVTYGEIMEAAKHYVIVFAPEGKGDLPVALLGLEQSHNAFIDERGQWNAPYIPAHVRRYPFILGAVEDVPDTYTVMVDLKAPHLSLDEGEPLLTDTGKPTPVLQEALDFLEGFEQDSKLTTEMVASIRAANVLVPHRLQAQQGQTRKVVETGFLVVDPERVTQLSDATFLQWRKHRLLNMLYAHLASLTNVERIPARKTPSVRRH